MKEGLALPDHILRLLNAPPKYSILMSTGYLKSKNAVLIHRQVSKVKGTLFGRSFWAGGYCVRNFAFAEQQIRKHIQEKEQEQLEFDFN